jgi:Flp pilus assembly protein CpaB
MRGRRFSLGHLIMIVSGLLAFLLTLTLVRGRNEVFRVAVAGRDIAAGTQVSPSSLRFIDLQVDDGTLRRFVQPADVRRVTGWVAATSISAGDPVTLSELRPPAAPNGLAAMSIPISPDLAVGGSLSSGDRVDVISVDGQAGTYLAQGALVLSVRGSGSGGLVGSSNDFSVTLAVDPQMALAIAVAIEQGDGHVQLVRSTGAERQPTAPVPAPTPTPSPTESSQGG